MQQSTLSSDILEQQFGATRIKILAQTSKLRIIATEVIETGKILEVSSVEFLEVPEEFKSIHEQVVNGESMGKAFKQNKVQFNRSTKGVWQSTVPVLFQNLFNTTADATIVDVLVTVGPQSIAYARITETYSPNVIWPEASKENVPTHVLNSLNQTVATLT